MLITDVMLDRFLDSLEEGVLFLDRTRHVMMANQSAAEMVGWDRGAMIGQLCLHLFRETACGRACERRGHCVLAPFPGNDNHVRDLLLVRPDGSTVNLRMWAMLLPSTEGNQCHSAIILRDRSHEIELEEYAAERLQFGGIVGHSPVMQKLYNQIMRAAKSDASVLISGESGTGKEMVARALHDHSARSQGPYVPVHCAALPEHLLESELFGYAKGAFSGATSTRIGRFEAADGGTMLLDEIGEIPLATQVKLLRVLQEREIVRLGENQARPVDVRVVAATHRNLAEMVRRGEFREDLYYRLCVLPMQVPALRERKEDISLIAYRLLNNLAGKYGRGDLAISRETLALLENHNWPGNVRQLFNALEYALVNSDGREILPEHLPPDIGQSATGNGAATPGMGLALRSYYRFSGSGQNEMALIERVLAETAGNKAEAARRLGMSRTSLWKRLKSRPDFANRQV